MGVKPTCAQPSGTRFDSPERCQHRGQVDELYGSAAGVAGPSTWGDVAQLGEGAECGQDTENGLEEGNEHPQEGEEKP